VRWRHVGVNIVSGTCAARSSLRVCGASRSNGINDMWLHHHQHQTGWRLARQAWRRVSGASRSPAAMFIAQYVLLA